MKSKILIAGALLSVFTYAYSVALVVPIAAAKVTTTAGASSAVSAIANLVGIALSAIVFNSGGINYKFDAPTDKVIPDSDITQLVPELSHAFQPNDKCAIWRTQYPGVQPDGTTCAPITRIVSSSYATANCPTSIPADQFISNKCPTGSGSSVWRYQYFKRVEGSTVAYIPPDFDTSNSVNNTSTPNNVVEIPLVNGMYQPVSDADLQPGVGGSSGRPAFTSGGSIYFQGMDTNNLLTVTKVTPSTSGTSIQEYSQVAQGQVRQTNASVAPNGVVQSATQNFYQGEVQNVPASSTNFVPEFNPVLNPTQNPAPEGSSSPGTGGSTTVEFPADYARTGESSAAAAQVVDGLLQGDLTTPTESTESMPWFGSTFDGLAPSLAVSSVCPVVSFGETRFGSFDSSAFCQMLQPQQGFLFAIFTAVWTLLGFRVVMSA